MLDYLRKHTIVIMAAMALVFVGLMFVGGDVSGGSLTGMFTPTFVSVDGKSYGEKDYNNMGRTGLSVAFSFPSTFGPVSYTHLHRPLVHTGHCRQRRQKSLHLQPRRGLRLPDWHSDPLGLSLIHI